jgi:hypothetical protein
MTHSKNMITLSLTPEEAAWLLMRLPIPDGDGSTFAGLFSHKVSAEISDKLKEAIERFAEPAETSVSGSGGEWYSC